MKMCNKCKRLLDESYFSKRSDTKDGLSYICKECKKEYDKKFDAKKREQLSKQQDKCVKCGKHIKYEQYIDGVYVISKFCNDCYPNQKFKDCKCDGCGKTFKVGRKPSKLNDFINRKYCPECSSSDRKELICPKCGSKYFVTRTPDGRHFKHKRVCDNCSKPQTEKECTCERCGKKFIVTKYDNTNSFKKIKYCSNECRLSIPEKYSICECCGKEFKLQRTSDGHFIPKQYCSDKCRLEIQRYKLELCKEERLNKIKKTCQEKYGVDYPCQTENYINSNPNIISETNLKFAELLHKINIEVEFEFHLGKYSYDFHVLNTNILIELNPTFTHTCADTGVYEPKDKYYHKNKTKYALENGFLCLCVWDWSSSKNIIEYLKEGFYLIDKGEPELHYSKGRKESDKQIDDGYLPVYDDGYKIVSLS